jgi:hypothetical protein
MKILLVSLGLLLVGCHEEHPAAISERPAPNSQAASHDTATKAVSDIPYEEEYDSVVYGNIQINGVPATGTKKDIVKRIGKPQKITRFVSDATTDRWWEYRYDSTILQVLDDGRFGGFELRTSAFTWRCGADSVKVGDPLSVLCNYFPASCRTMKHWKGETVRVRCQGSDGFIHFEIKNDVVASIETWQDI